MVNPSFWQLTGTAAAFTDGAWRAKVDLLRPSAGLHDLGCGNNGPGSLLGIDVADGAELSLAETYVRGSDLVATYPQTAARSFRLQAYYRRVGSAHIELQVSINTSLLNVQPFVDVRTQLPGGDWLELPAGGFLFRPAAGEWSYFEANHPRDDTKSRLVESADGVQIVHRLFDRPLEKGVIMRSRLRGAFVPRAGDEAASAAIYREFAESRPPLTT